MKNVYFLLCMLLVFGLLAVGPVSAQQPPCVDVNGDGGGNIMDLAIMLDDMYITGTFDPAMASVAAGLDGYEGVTSNDVMALTGWMFIDPDATPDCGMTEGWDYPVSTNDTLRFSNLLVPAGESTASVNILAHTLSEFQSLSLTFDYGLDGNDITLTSISWLADFDLSELSLTDSANNRVALAMVDFYGVFEPIYGYAPIARLTFDVAPAGEDRMITITPIDWDRNGSRHTTVLSRYEKWNHKIAGYLPVITYFADNPDQDDYGHWCFGGCRGNIDGSADEMVDITDLQVLVDYVYIQGVEPPVVGEADVAPLDGADGIVDISDVSALVDHLFLTLKPLPTCTECAAAKRAPREGGSLAVSHENGSTVLDLNASEELRGLQLVLRGDGIDPMATSPLEDQMDLLVGHRGDDLLVGLIDLDGPSTIPIGDSRVFELNGNYEVVSATAASMEHVSLALNLGVEAQVPGSFALNQNYPNPFNPTTEISFSIPNRGHVELSVYNSLGQRVTTLVDGVRDGGDQTVTWNGTDQSGNSVASGVYFYRLKADGYSDSKKMLLLK